MLSSGKNITFSKFHPLKINGLVEKKSNADLAVEITLENVSTAVCGVCKELKRSKSDRAFR